jgi:uncharacterized protein (TIGR02246 family)
MRNDNEKQIRTLFGKWATAVQNKDINGILANHSEDIVMFDVPFPLQSKGITEYKRTWEVFFTWTKDSRSFDFTELEITLSDTVAFCHAIGHCTGEDSTGLKENLTFRLTMGLKKIDGQWIITHEHHSLPNTEKFE